MKITGAWSEAEAQMFLDDTIVPLRLAVNRSDGFPLVLSLWFVRAEWNLLCATGETSRVVHYLQQNPKCGFEVAADDPPYRGVRGKGTVLLLREQASETLDGLIHRYLGDQYPELARWLRSKSSTEVKMVIKPEAITSWDYSLRMR